MGDVTSADLSGRAGGYRGVAIRCPGCAESMRQLSLAKAEAEVDVCDACGGLWVDWFDGEVRAIATETMRVSEPGPRPDDATKTDGRESRPRNEAHAVGACPRCTRQLVNERYAVTAEVASSRIEGRTSIASGTTGAELLRCEDCMGAFVSRTSAELLSWLSSASDEAPVSTSTGVVEPLPWERFIALLKSFLGVK